jgi:hypothetical protein
MNSALYVNAMDLGRTRAQKFAEAKSTIKCNGSHSSPQPAPAGARPARDVMDKTLRLEQAYRRG